MKPQDTKVELLTCESGDWEILKVNAKIVEQGHSIRWVEVIKFLGYNFEETYVTDELILELSNEWQQ
jgi:hypothetical protein